MFFQEKIKKYETLFDNFTEFGHFSRNANNLWLHYVKFILEKRSMRLPPRQDFLKRIQNREFIFLKSGYLNF